MLLNLLILLIISCFYGGVLLFNDYLSGQIESNFLSPIIMALAGVMFLVIPIYIGLNPKMHILSIFIVNIVGYAIYWQFRIHNK